MREARALLRRDRAFRPIIDKVGSIELRVRRPYFWTLCSAIIAQQVSSAAARTIIARVRALYPELRLPDPESILATTPARLREVGVSRQKARYLQALAEAFARGSLTGVRFSRLSDEEILERLMAIVGIGRWTAEMFLIFSMRRPDVFPVDDLGVRQGMKRFFRVAEVPDMVRRAERWRPYRTVASLYLWRGLET
ncbi:MAG: DNA-3-methyladenine glycosylase 2 family protein [Gemmatimonadota bacterium]|nr:MAG: DNA-3-methyladenine glycosylase 2 family protein [Gemmatimonadota bacterium]